MSDWHQQIKHDDDYWAESVKIDFAVNLDRVMKRAGISKTALAKKIKSSQAYVTKVLRGDSNLTIDSMVKLSRAAEGSLHIAIVHQTSTEQWVSLMEKNRVTLDRNADLNRAWIKQAQQNGRSHESSEIAA